MEYSIPEINNGVAKVQFTDGSWTFVQLASDMTEADLDDIVYRITPPHLMSGATPSFLVLPVTRTAAEKPDRGFRRPTSSICTGPHAAYGTLESQIEYITENGLEAWQTKVAQIKADNPKA